MIKAWVLAAVSFGFSSAQAASLATASASLLDSPNGQFVSDPTSVSQIFSRVDMSGGPNDGILNQGEARASATSVGVGFDGILGSVAATFEDQVVMYLLPGAALSGPVTISIAGQVTGSVAETDENGVQKAPGDTTVVKVGLQTYSLDGTNPGGVPAARGAAIGQATNGQGVFVADTVGTFSTTYSVGGSQAPVSVATIQSEGFSSGTSRNCEQLGLPPGCEASDRLQAVSLIEETLVSTFGFGVALGVGRFGESGIAEVDFLNSFDIDGLIATDAAGNVLPAVFFGASGEEYTIAAFDPIADVGNPIPVPGAMILMAPALLVVRRGRRAEA